jgi:mannitol/fructose-specific phosphotransferase system IIA component (Ntr-type)
MTIAHQDQAAGSGQTLTLAHLTNEALVIPRLKSGDMAGAIRELSEAFERHDPVWLAAKLCEAALQREGQMSTAMEFGGGFAAFPHVRSEVCPRLMFAVGLEAGAITWGGGAKVQAVFLNAVPANEAMGYLKLVLAQGRLGKDAAVWGKFRGAGTVGVMWECLGRIPVRR